ncbi:MAG TPA: hypothetical protein PKD91_08695 [Bacteroidia bacterium]|nr:hypothetical protein [Bacteroidia bacterium]
MKTTTILGAFLIISVAINIYLWQDKTGNVTTCVSTPGFERPTTISKDEADGFMNQFRLTLNDTDTITGGLITRSSLDEIMCTKDCNAIVYSFGRDSLGRTGPGGNGAFTILSGVKVDYDASTHTITRVSDLGIKKYIPRNYCPPTCMAQ